MGAAGAGTHTHPTSTPPRRQPAISPIPLARLGSYRAPISEKYARQADGYHPTEQMAKQVTGQAEAATHEPHNKDFQEMRKRHALFIKFNKRIWQQVDVAEVAGPKVPGYVSLTKTPMVRPALAPF